MCRLCVAFGLRGTDNNHCSPFLKNYPVTGISHCDLSFVHYFFSIVFIFKIFRAYRNQLNRVSEMETSYAGRWEKEGNLKEKQVGFKAS